MMGMISNVKLCSWMSGSNVSTDCNALIIPLSTEYGGTAILRNADNNSSKLTSNSNNSNADTSFWHLSLFQSQKLPTGRQS
jgi:hypothetical protein